MQTKNYALVVYINHNHDNKEIAVIHICKRVKYSFIRDSKVNSGEQFVKVYRHKGKYIQT